MACSMKRWGAMRYMLLTSFVVIAGCVGGPELDEPEESPPDPSRPPGVFYIAGEQEQGRRLLGSYADLFMTPVDGHFRVSGTSPSLPTAWTVTVEGANLVVKNGTAVQFANVDPRFMGLRLSAVVGGGELEIVGASALRPGVTRYRLIHHTGAGPVPYCADDLGAVPIKGRWTATGLHEQDTTISFACDDAVGYKCTDWGYPAGALGPGSVGWDHHQACTRMARADYCADGTPHTFDGTAIVIRDLISGAMPDLDDPTVPQLVQSPHPAPPDRFWFEGAWSGGASPVKCLSKVRWASMPLDGPCPGVVLDPRTVPGAKFCEDYWPDHITPDGTSLLFNSSKVGQMYMHRWSTSTGQQLVTVRGWRDPVHGDEPPFPSYVNYHGPVGLLMRNPPSSLTGVLADVYSQRDPGTTDRFVGFWDAFSTYNRIEREGSTYVDNPAGDRIPLNLYIKGSDRVSAPIAPPGFPPSSQGSFGFIDKP